MVFYNNNNKQETSIYSCSISLIAIFIKKIYSELLQVYLEVPPFMKLNFIYEASFYM